MGMEVREEASQILADILFCIYFVFICIQNCTPLHVTWLNSPLFLLHIFTTTDKAAIVPPHPHTCCYSSSSSEELYPPSMADRDVLSASSRFCFFSTSLSPLCPSSSCATFLFAPFSSASPVAFALPASTILPFSCLRADRVLAFASAFASSSLSRLDGTPLSSSHSSFLPAFAIASSSYLRNARAASNMATSFSSSSLFFVSSSLFLSSASL
mmetsp:Transcript_4167/g.8202  ORF Transcript_4167/g.8202 Transcript_4167/m.8202 type:complete len:213 (+) Transcript_4167:1181-1819(+)